QDERCAPAEIRKGCQVEIASVEVVGMQHVPITADEVGDAVASGKVEVLMAPGLEDPRCASSESPSRVPVVDLDDVRVGRLLQAHDQGAPVAALAKFLVKLPGNLRRAAGNVDGVDLDDVKRCHALRLGLDVQYVLGSPSEAARSLPSSSKNASKIFTASSGEHKPRCT